MIISYYIYFSFLFYILTTFTMLMISSRNDLLLYSTTATNREETRFIKFARHRHQVVQPAPHLLNTNHTSHIHMKIHKIRTQQRQQQTTAYTRRTSTCIGPPHHKLKEMCSPFFLILLRMYVYLLSYLLLYVLIIASSYFQKYFFLFRGSVLL